MPGGLEAALVAAVLVVPGFLFLAGYRLGRASPSHPDALTSVARAFTASAALVLGAWKLGGQSLYEHARAATALSDDEPLTFRLAVAGLVVPPIVGVLAGEATDLLASRVAAALDKLEQADGELGRTRRTVLWALRKLRARLPLDGPTTWDRVWTQLRRDEPYLYVRVVTADGQTVVGTIGRQSRAAVSPQARDLYIEEVLRPIQDPEGHTVFAPTKAGKGMFLAGEHIAVVEWIGHDGITEIRTDG